MFIRLMKYIKGYVRIRLEGASPERFMNLCSNRNILLWNIKEKDNTYEMHISVRGFFELAPILKKTKTKVHVMEKTGVPFVMHKYRKRKIFFLGVILCCLAVHMCSHFIWQIEIYGNCARTTDVLLDYLESENIYHGIRKEKINCEEIETMLRIKYNDIIWASAQIKGTRLVIQLKENTDITLDEKTEEMESDILSNKDAVIVKMVTRKGTPMVSERDVVKEGDVLVSGQITILDDAEEPTAYHYVAADADIYGKTIYDYNDVFPLTYEEKLYQEKDYKGYYAKVLDTCFYFGRNRTLEPKQDMATEETQLHLGENFYLPITLGEYTIRKYEVIQKKYTKEQANQVAKKRLREFCENLNEKGVEILENNVTIEVTGKECQTTGRFVLIEKLGVRSPVEKIEIKEQESEVNNGENN